MGAVLVLPGYNLRFAVWRPRALAGWLAARGVMGRSGASSARKRGRGNADGGGGRWSDRWSLGLAMFILGFALLLPHLVPGLDLDREFEVDAGRIDLTVVPGWLESGAQERLEQSLAALGSVSLRSRAQIAALVEVVEDSSPWIERVERAEKVYPDQLELTLELRSPAAALVADHGRYWVDGEGRVLGSTELLPGKERNERPLLVYRRGVAPRVRVGEVLEDDALLAGIRVAAELTPHLVRLRRRGIDLALVDVTPLATDEPGRTTDVLLWTPDGFFVQWGRAEPRSDEPSTAHKLRTLESAWDRRLPFEDIVGICVQYPTVPTFVTRGGRSLAAAGFGPSDGYR